MVSSSSSGIEMARLSPPTILGGGWERKKEVQGMIDPNVLSQIYTFHRTCEEWSNLEIVFHKAGV